MVYDLNQKQIAALQAIANICAEGQCASYPSLVKSVLNHRNTQLLCDEKDIEQSLRTLYNELFHLGYVTLVVYKGEPHVELTQSGYRCNAIQVD